MVSLKEMFLQNETIPLSTINEFIEELIMSHQDEDKLVYFSTPFNEITTFQTPNYDDERIQVITQSAVSLDNEVIMEARPTLTLREHMTEREDNEIFAIMNYRVYNQRTACTYLLMKIFPSPKPFSFAWC